MTDEVISLPRKGGTTIVQPLDGSVPVTGTLEPEVAGTQSIGSETKPFGAVHTDEIYLGPNSLYVDGQKAIGTDAEGKLQLGSISTPINLVSSEPVKVNNVPIAAYGFKADKFLIPGQVVSGNKVVLSFAPIKDSERVILNGIELTEGEDYDYTIRVNEITFNSNVLTNDGHVKVAYNY